jgi:hypothetical protein
MASTMYKGKNLRIRLDDNVIYHATDCSFSSDIEIEKIATKDTNGNLKITGAYDWNLSSSGVVSNKPNNGTQEDFKSLLDKHRAGTSVFIEFTTGEAGDVIISGDGFIKSISVKAPEKGFATSDLTIEGSGDYDVALNS